MCDSSVVNMIWRTQAVRVGMLAGNTNIRLHLRSVCFASCDNTFASAVELHYA